MAGFHGGDTEQMRQQAERVAAGAARLGELADLATAAVQGVTWEGPDADAFRLRSVAVLRGEIEAVVRRLEAEGTEVREHAEDQDRASTDLGTGGGRGTGGPFGPLGPWGPLGPTGPGGPLGPLMPFPPVPGLGGLPDLLDRWASGGGATGPQEFYGDPGYRSRGQMFGLGRPVGDQFSWNPTLWDGREIENRYGHVDGWAGLNSSAGTSVTTDPYGNVTGTVGARGSAEIGVEALANLPGGFSLEAGARAGAEAYAEAGGTIGPDGFGAGARAGAGVYGEQTATLAHENGFGLGMSQSYYAGAEAHAGAYSHVTRTEDGEVNGFSTGFEAGAFAGASVGQGFEVSSPGGWFSGSTGLSAKAGAGASLGAGTTVSTDEISVTVGGSLAAELGLGGYTTLAVNPNAIVDSFTPGDYDIDDAIAGASGAFDAGADWVSDRWPF